MLGAGAFGKVLEVKKRDCERTYAMKVQAKSMLEQTFGDVWEKLAIIERKLMGSLHHPLLVNLAYAFQVHAGCTLAVHRVRAFLDPRSRILPPLTGGPLPASDH